MRLGVPGRAAGLLIAWSAFIAERPSDTVQWSAKASATAARPGDTLNVELTATIESGWHIYAMTQPASGPVPLAIAVPAAGFQLVAAKIDAPLPIVMRDPTFDADTHYYEDKVTLSLPVVVRSAVKPGKQALPIEVTFQACSNRICLRPFTEKLSVEITVAATKGRRS